jgi:hypothetical protein
MTNVRAEDPVASWQQPYYTLARSATGPLSVSAAETGHDLLVSLFPTPACMRKAMSNAINELNQPVLFTIANAKAAAIA